MFVLNTIIIIIFLHRNVKKLHGNLEFRKIFSAHCTKQHRPLWTNPLKISFDALGGIFFRLKNI